MEAFVSQCLLPVHKTPSPLYPTMHSHRYEPSVFVQVAKWEQSSVFELHSSISDKGKTALIEINMTNRAITTAMTICKSSLNFRLQFIVPRQYYRHEMFVNCALLSSLCILTLTLTLTLTMICFLLFGKSLTTPL